MKNLLKESWLWIVIFLVVAVLGLHVRFYPLRAHIWSDTTEQATVFVLSKLKAMIAGQVMAEMPDAPAAQRNQVIEQKFAETVHNDAAMVRKTIAQAARNLHDQMPAGADRVYLQEADGYYYYDLTQNIEKFGNIAHRFKGSKYLNEKMAAPFGFWQPVNFHPFVGFSLFKIINLFKPGTPMLNALCYTGPVLSVLVLAAFLWLCRVMSMTPLAAAIGAVYFYLSPIFVKRSTFAWYDDDSHNLLFPLLILAVVFQALKTVKNRRDGVIHGVIASLLFAAYSLFWHGWGYTFGIVMISALAILAAGYALDLHFKPHLAEKKTKAIVINSDLAAFFLTTLAATVVLVCLMFGVGGFFGIFQEGFGELKKFTTNQLSLWPNLFVAVGELKRSSIKGITDMTGNAFSLCGAFLSIPLAAYIAYNRRDRAAIYQLIILVVLLLADLKITLGAERFILLCLIPVSILFTIGLNCLIGLLRNVVHPVAPVPPRPSGLEFSVGAVIAAAAILFPIQSIYAQVPELLSPIFNATWEKALADVKAKTSPDGIVTTWWPPGHFIKAVADRRVTFDGATLSKSKEAYWIANVLLTSDERKAAGILRMLNTSATNAVDYLESMGIKTSDAVALLHTILPLTKDEAARTLQAHMPSPAVDKLLSMTHTPPPPSYVLIYSELMEKNIGLQFVGKWNFKAIEELNKNPQALKNLPPASSPAFFEFLWSTIGGPYKYSEALIAIAEDGQRIQFDQGLTVNLTTMSAVINSPKFGKGVPLSIVYSDGTKVVENKLPNHTLNYSVVLFKENTRYYCRLMDQELANSLLVKFFIFKGVGMEFFRPVTQQSDMTGRDEVSVFELRREKL